MLNLIEDVRNISLTEIESVNSLEELDRYRIKFLARNGMISELFDRLREVSDKEKPAVGKALNELKTKVQSLFDQRKQILESRQQKKSRKLDLTLPGRTFWVGSEHPLTQTLDEIKRIF